MNRSYLFIPGNNPGMIQNADVYGADAIIFDLEDSVHTFEKDNARHLVKEYLKLTKDYPSTVVIRINSNDTSFYEKDLEAVVSDKIDMIMLPKARVASLILLEHDLKKIEELAKMKKVIGIIPIIEQAISLTEINLIASLPRVQGLLLGAEDLCNDLEISRTKEGLEILYARSKVITAAKAYGIEAIDTPFTDVLDDDGFMADAMFSASIGMKAKAAIHPRQIDIINQIYSPSEESISWAKKVLEAEKNAFKKGLGVFSLDGKMIDKPIIEKAKKVIKKAIVFGLLRIDYEK